MKERRCDIPALYNDLSQSQDNTSLQPWTPKQVIIPGDSSHDTMIINDSSNSRSNSRKENTETKTGDVNNKDESNSRKRPARKTEDVAEDAKTRRLPREIALLETDTVEGKRAVRSGRRLSIDREAKSREAGWRKHLLPSPRVKKSQTDKPLPSSSTGTKKALVSSNQENVSKSINESPKNVGLLNSKEDSVTKSPLKHPGKCTVEQKSPQKTVSPSMLTQVTISETPAFDTQIPANSPIKSEAVSPVPDSVTVSAPKTRARAQVNLDSEMIPSSQPTQAVIPTPDHLVTPTHGHPNEMSPVSVTRRSNLVRAENFDKLSTRTTRLNTPLSESITPLNPPTPKEPTVKSPRKMLDAVVVNPIQVTPELDSSNKSQKKNDTLELALQLESELIKPITQETPPTEIRKSPRKVEVVLTDGNGFADEGRKSPRKLESPKPNLQQKTPTDNPSSPKQKRIETESPVEPPRKSPRLIENSEPSSEEIPSSQELPPKKNARKTLSPQPPALSTPTRNNTNGSTTPPPSAERRKSPRNCMEDSPVSTSESARDAARRSFNFEEAERLDLQGETETSPKLSNTICSSPEPSMNATKLAEFLNDTVNLSPITAKSPMTRHQAAVATAEREAANVSPTLPTDRKVTRASTSNTGINPTAAATASTSNATFESPKSTSIYQGRGAHMMNMLLKINSSTPNEQKLSTTDDTIKTADFFEFSKTLPPADASPSASILKRKLDESDVIESGNKRKRVSFHDPPVSLTKEYIRHEEEIKSPSVKAVFNRALLMTNLAQNSSGTKVTGDGEQNPNRYKYPLKRKNKRDCRTELLKLGTATINVSPQLPTAAVSIINKSADTSENNADANFAPAEVSVNDSTTLFNFKSKTEILDFCLNELSIDEILERAVDKEMTFGSKSIKILTKELESQMVTDSKLCYSILDRFSEKHAKEFLEHALKENSTKAICDRLTMQTLMNYISDKISQDQESKFETLKWAETLFAGAMTREETLTFLINVMPEKLTVEEIEEMLNEIFTDRTSVEIFDILMPFMRKGMIDMNI